MAAVKKRTPPWSYLSLNTPLHRCPAGIKLMCLLALTSASVWGFSHMADSSGLALEGSGILGATFAACALAIILFGSFCAGISLPALFAGSRPLVIMLFIFTVFRIVNIKNDTDGGILDSGILSNLYIDIVSLKSGLLLSAGIFACFAAASLFFAVTTTGELRVSLAKAELFLCAPFQKKRKHTSTASNQGRLSLSLALMLGFLPRFFEYWENSSLAVRARGCSGKIREIMAILPLVTERMIEAASDTAEALESRGLTVENH